MRLHDQQGEQVMPLLSWSRDHIEITFL
jgi:hypothetical protein